MQRQLSPSQVSCHSSCLCQQRSLSGHSTGCSASPPGMSVSAPGSPLGERGPWRRTARKCECSQAQPGSECSQEPHGWIVCFESHRKDVT